MLDKLNLEDKNSLQVAYKLYKDGDIEGQEYLDFMVKYDNKRRELKELREKAGYTTEI
jgi:hypothetical protein